MLLYRYELICGEEPQDIGFLRGLKDTGLSDKRINELTKVFEDNLIIPHYEDYDIKNGIFFFTEKGKEFFKKDIKKINKALDEFWWSIIEKTLELSTISKEDIIYEDDLQLCIRRK